MSGDLFLRYSLFQLLSHFCPELFLEFVPVSLSFKASTVFVRLLLMTLNLSFFLVKAFTK